MCDSVFGPYAANAATRGSRRQSHKEHGGDSGCTHPQSQNQLRVRVGRGFACQRVLARAVAARSNAPADTADTADAADAATAALLQLGETPMVYPQDALGLLQLQTVVSAHVPMQDSTGADSLSDTRTPNAGPVVGSYLRLSGEERDAVHEVQRIEVLGTGRQESISYYLSGRRDPTTLKPTPGGSRWTPVERGPGIMPATLLDGIGLMVRVINLPSRPDRLASVRDHLQRCAPELEWHPFSAVDCRESSWKSLVDEGIVSSRGASDGQLGVPTLCSRTGSFSDHLTLPAVGCAMSHASVWRDLVSYERGSSCALVLEDDIDAVSVDLVASLTDLLCRRGLPSCWRFAYLGSQ